MEERARSVDLGWRQATRLVGSGRALQSHGVEPAVAGIVDLAVEIVVEPNVAGKGYEFDSKVVGGSVPKEYIPGVEKGLNSVLGSGVLAGFPVVDIKVKLVDGAYHEVDSSALAFEIAARSATSTNSQPP